MCPDRLNREARDGTMLRGETGLDDELPRRKVVAVPNMASCIEQEVGYLRRSPQHLNF
jgi:hypothetical protein